MTAFLVALILATPATPAAGGGHPRPDVQVTASDADGKVDAGLANALAQALVDAGLPAAPERLSAHDCGDECVRVSVRKTEDRRFLIEVRARGDLAREPLALDPGASSFDQVHALAIEAELLAARLRPPARRRARAVLAASASLSLPVPPPPADAVPADGPPSEPVSATVDQPAATIPPGRAAATVLDREEPRPVPAAEARLSLNIAATMLAGASGDLFMHGVALGIRLRLSRRLDARASISFLRPQAIEEQGQRYHLELLPLAVAVAAEIPGVPGLRAGGGVEGLLVSAEQNGGGPSSWSIGPIARLEYRHAIRSFALLASLQAALHPASWNTAPDASPPPVTIPRWTTGVALGLEFNVF